ncbi:hypothetical protein [Dysosmobacter sp. Phy]
MAMCVPPKSISFGPQYTAFSGEMQEKMQKNFCIAGKLSCNAELVKKRAKPGEKDGRDAGRRGWFVTAFFGFRQRPVTRILPAGRWWR